MDFGNPRGAHLTRVEFDDEKTTGKQRNIRSWTRRSFDTRLSFSAFG